MDFLKVLLETVLSSPENAKTYFNCLMRVFVSVNPTIAPDTASQGQSTKRMSSGIVQAIFASVWMRQICLSPTSDETAPLHEQPPFLVWSNVTRYLNEQALVYLTKASTSADNREVNCRFRFFEP